MAAMSKDEIFQTVRDILMDSLGAEEELITPEARLTDDLGAESIDYLDIAFQMEKTFGISIKPQEMLLGESPGDDLIKDGKITDRGLAELRVRMPHVCFDDLEKDRNVKHILSVFTVDSLVRFVFSRLNSSDCVEKAKSQ